MIIGELLGINEHIFLIDRILLRHDLFTQTDLILQIIDFQKIRIQEELILIMITLEEINECYL